MNNILKRVLVTIGLIVLFVFAYGLGDTNARAEVEATNTDQNQAMDKCFNQLWGLNDRMLTYYNGLLDWQNVGYALDDYSAGALNTQIDQWNTDKDAYNASCVSKERNAQAL